MLPDSATLHVNFWRFCSDQSRDACEVYVLAIIVHDTGFRVYLLTQLACKGKGRGLQVQAHFGNSGHCIKSDKATVAPVCSCQPATHRGLASS